MEPGVGIEVVVRWLPGSILPGIVCHSFPVWFCIAAGRTPWHARLGVWHKREVIRHPKPNECSLFAPSIVGALNGRRVLLKDWNHVDFCSTMGRGFSFLPKFRPHNHSDLPAAYSDFPRSIGSCAPRLRRKIRRGHHGPVDPIHRGVDEPYIRLDMRSCSVSPSLANIR
jgi:hypothetical protein